MSASRFRYSAAAAMIGCAFGAAYLLVVVLADYSIGGGARGAVSYAVIWSVQGLVVGWAARLAYHHAQERDAADVVIEDSLVPWLAAGLVGGFLALVLLTFWLMALAIPAAV